MVACWPQTDSQQPRTSRAQLESGEQGADRATDRRGFADKRRAIDDLARLALPSPWSGGYEVLGSRAAVWHDPRPLSAGSTAVGMRGFDRVQLPGNASRGCRSGLVKRRQNEVTGNRQT